MTSVRTIAAITPSIEPKKLIQNRRMSPLRRTVVPHARHKLADMGSGEAGVLKTPVLFAREAGRNGRSSRI